MTSPAPVRLADGLWWLPTDAANCYAWSSSEGWVVIDPGLAGQHDARLATLDEVAAREGLPQAGRRVAAVVLTHWHGDHAGAAAALADVAGTQVWAGPEDAEVLRGQLPPTPPLLSESERGLYEQIMTANGVASVPPHIAAVKDLRAQDARLLALGVRVISAPGHTPGSLALHVPAASAVITGDLARTDDAGNLAFGLFHTAPQQVRAWLMELAGLEPSRACVGHGPPLLSGAADGLRRAAAPPRP